MPGKRSRQGCEECRKRRKKCDEQKPTCGRCASFRRTCEYTLKLVWGGARHEAPPAAVSTSSVSAVSAVSAVSRLSTNAETPLSILPSRPPPGVPLPAPYRRLLDYFARDVLASLSAHPSIHQDLCRGLVPAMLQSPHLLAAGLALSAAGLASRGLSAVAGADLARLVEHLQSSGLALLRHALQRGLRDGVLLATCLLWCLADVFAGDRAGSAASWRIHLHGVKALLGGDQAFSAFVTSAGSSRSAMRHLYLLYLSLQTLPYVPAEPAPAENVVIDPLPASTPPDLHIDGFLGYSEELLDVLQQIDRIAISGSGSGSDATPAEADVLLGKARAMIRRDATTPLPVSISPVLSAASGREFVLCHRIFQQATLIHLYRRLFRLPSRSAAIQAAVGQIHSMAARMTQGQPCNTWVAMSMPLFTVGCEACSAAQQAFARDSVDKLAASIGSMHVRVVRQALEDVWRLRASLGDTDGRLCAARLLDELNYNIILF